MRSYTSANVEPANPVRKRWDVEVSMIKQRVEAFDIFTLQKEPKRRKSERL